MDVFVARQAILNRHKDVYGYELLFRSNGESNQFDGTDSSSATSQVIANTLFSAGLEGILGGKKAFINFDRKMLLDGSFSLLPRETVVIEVLEDDLKITAEMIARACEKLNSEQRRGEHPVLQGTIQEIASSLSIAVLQQTKVRGKSMLQMVEAKKVSPKAMVTGTCDLNGINKVFEEMNTFQNVGVTVCNQY